MPSALAIMMALVQGPVLKWASRRWSDRARVLGGTLILAASFPFFSSADLIVLYAGSALLAIGNGIMWPSLLAILSRMTERSVQGTVQGFASSAGAVASIAGLLLGGLLYASFGSRVFVVSAILVALTCGLSLLLPAKGSAKDG